MEYLINLIFQTLGCPIEHLFQIQLITKKVPDSDWNYSQVRFTIVENHDDPLPAIVWLADKHNKALSNVVGNKDIKVFIMIYHQNFQNINVGIIRYGRLSIRVNRIKNKITEIRVQLYQYISKI